MRVLVDLDGVVYDWTGIYLRLYHELSGEELPPDFRWEWHFMRQLPNTKAKSAITKSSRLWTEGVAYPGAIVALRELCLTHDTYIATQPGPRPDIAVPGKVAWLKRTAPWFDVERLICIKHKHLLQADSLIDDRPENLVTWMVANPQGTGILIARPWNVVEQWFGPLTVKVAGDLAEAARFLDDLETHEKEISGSSLLQKRVVP